LNLLFLSLRVYFFLYTSYIRKLFMEYEQKVGEVISRPYFRLAFVVVCLILLSFVAIKEGFSLWILSKLRITKERLTPNDQSAINRFYPGMAGTSAAAQKQLGAWTGVYDA
jgi:hypothetical protein